MTSRGKKGRVTRIRLAVIALLFMVVAVFWSLEPAVPELNEWFVDDRKYHTEISAAAARHGLDPDLVRALVFQESRFRSEARGRHGEIGLMQILPAGAVAEWSRIHKCPPPTEKELFDVRVNLDIGCWYLSRALRRWKDYDSRLELALAQYNAGESRARAWAPKAKNGAVIPQVTISGTRNYINRIMKRYRTYVLRRSASDVAPHAPGPDPK